MTDDIHEQFKTLRPSSGRRLFHFAAPLPQPSPIP